MVDSNPPSRLTSACQRLNGDALDVRERLGVLEKELQISNVGVAFDNNANILSILELLVDVLPWLYCIQ